MQLLYLPILILAAIIFAGVSLFFASRPLRGAVLVLAAYLYEILIVTVPPIPIGVLIYPADIVAVLLFVAAILRCAVGKTKPKGMQLIPIALFVLFSICMVRGLGVYGLKDAGNAGREFFYFLSGVFYFSTFNLSSRLLKRLVTLWMATSMVMVGIAVFRWLATVAGLGIVAQWNMGGETSIRVLNAEQALCFSVHERVEDGASMATQGILPARAGNPVAATPDSVGIDDHWSSMAWVAGCSFPKEGDWCNRSNGNYWNCADRISVWTSNGNRYSVITELCD
jgi:hypothetical protein